LYTGGTVYFIHNLEDALQDIVLNRSTDLSIFDADIVPVGSVNDRAKAYNKNAVDINVERSQSYETVKEFYDNLVNSIEYFKNGKYSFDMRLAKRLYYELKGETIKDENEVKNSDLLMQFLQERIEEAIDIEKRRKKNYKKGIELNNFEYIDSKVVHTPDVKVFDERIKDLENMLKDVKSVKGKFDKIIKNLDFKSKLLNTIKNSKKGEDKADVVIDLSEFFSGDALGSDVGGDRVKKKF
jgi:hypothetical protein